MRSGGDFDIVALVFGSLTNAVSSLFLLFPLKCCIMVSKTHQAIIQMKTKTQLDMIGSQYVMCISVIQPYQIRIFFSHLYFSFLLDRWKTRHTIYLLKSRIQVNLFVGKFVTYVCKIYSMQRTRDICWVKIELLVVFLRLLRSIWTITRQPKSAYLDLLERRRQLHNFFSLMPTTHQVDANGKSTTIQDSHLNELFSVKRRVHCRQQRWQRLEMNRNTLRVTKRTNCKWKNQICL